MHCREITLVLWKSQRGVGKCATAYGMFYACKCSLDLSRPYSVKIFSHQESPGVVYPEFFVTRFKIKEADHIRGDYLVTLFSFGRFTRQENLSYRFLKSGSKVIVIFTKSTRYCAYSTKKFADREPNEEICWQRAKKGEVVRRNSQGLDKVIHVYLLILLNSLFKR